MECGSEWDTTDKHFFKVLYSHRWDNNDTYCPTCIPCLEKHFDEYRKRYGERMALTIICYYLDIPFFFSLYDSVIKKNTGNFRIGMYVRLLNGKQYTNKTFINTLLDKKELNISQSEFDKEKEVKWTKDEQTNKNNAISIIGYDPFDGYPENDRRFLFSELIKYFDDDIADDTYKLSQIIQIVNNNNQIRRYDVLISTTNPVSNADDIKVLNDLKKSLVASNDKIAKENEISVKNRSNKEMGKSTLTALMRKLREQDFKTAEEDYYSQLMSAGTQWAMDMSHKSLCENGFFDENDKQEIFIGQRELVQKIQKDLDIQKEENRQLLIQIDNLNRQIRDGASK